MLLLATAFVSGFAADLRPVCDAGFLAACDALESPLPLIFADVLADTCAPNLAAGFGPESREMSAAGGGDASRKAWPKLFE